MTISFIGAGSMGGALIRGVCRKIEADRVTVYAPSARNTAALKSDTGCRVAATAAEAISGAKYVVLAVKPQILPDVLRELLPLEPGQVLVSVAAGLTIETLETLADGAPVIRIMPNTPVLTGQGMLLLTGGTAVSVADTAELAGLLSECGMVELVEEKFLDAGSPVMACSPAYVYMFIEALADGGVKIGLPRAQAQRWAAQAVLGAADLLLKSDKHPGALKDDVCSPGGTTIAGVAALEEKGFRSTVISAVEAAYKRNNELGKK